jgi:hypothetical protein
MRQSAPRLDSVNEAVEWLAANLPENTVHIVRGGTQADALAMQFGLGT